MNFRAENPHPEPGAEAAAPAASPFPRLNGRRIVFAANTAWYLHNHHRETLRAFREAGAEVIVLVPSGPCFDDLSKAGCRVIPLRLSPASKNPLHEAMTFAAFATAYRRLRPHAVFHFTVKCNLYGGAAARLLGIPYVNNVPGLGAAFRRDGLLRKVVQGALRIAQRDAGQVFLQNPDDLRFMLEKGLATEAQALLIPGSGVDLERFAPLPERAEDGRTVFVFAGRLLREKGLAELAEAMRRLRAEHPGAVCRVHGFLAPGDGRYVQRSELSRWEEEGLLEYRGPLEDVRPAYAEADCAVLPTYYREGIPKSLLEAAAMALPIVATSLTGCRAVVREGENGFLCEPRDAGSLADALRRAIAAGPEGRAALGRRGRAIAESAFGVERVARAYLDAAAALMPSAV